MNNKKPNFFLFVADQMRNDSLAHMGNPASITPSLDNILEDGISFKNAYCQNPVCVPSRCSFLTGLYPHTTGHRTMHFLQNPDEPNLLKTMKSNGYEVIWIGRNDVIPSGADKTPYCDEYYSGFDMSFTRPKKADEKDEDFYKQDDNYYSFFVGKIDNVTGIANADWNCVNYALDYIERKSKDPESKPFFVYCTVFFPHPPYLCEEPWYSSIDRNKLLPRRPNIKTLKDRASMLYSINEKQNLNGWTEDRFTELRATYLAMVSRFDSQYQLLSNKLKEHNFYDNTSIFVFSDHGDYTSDYNITEKSQNCFEDPVSNIPLLVKPSKDFKVKPRISNALVELVDIPKTITEMANIKLDYVEFGKSLLETIAGNEQHKDAVFCEGGRIHGEIQAMEKGHGPSSTYWPRLSTQESEGPEHTKACMIRMGNLKYTMRLYEKDELYDLYNDPLELNNVIENEKYKNDIQKLKERLLAFYMETTDFVPNKRDQR